MASGMAEVAKLLVSIGFKDAGLTRGISKATAGLGKLEGRAGKIGGNIAKGAAVAGTIVAAGSAAAIAASVRAASEFEAQLNTINTVAQEGAAGLEDISDGIRDLARTTGTSHTDLSAAYYDLVSAGISAADAQDVLTQANKLAIGGLSTTAEAVDLLTTAINSYGGDASQAATFTDYFAQAIGAGKVTAAELAGSFAKVGPIAAQFGIGVDEISAAIGVMTAKGTPASEAMTQIRAAMVALMKPNAALSSLQKDLGVNFEKMAKKKGLAFAYNELTKAAKKAGVPMAKLTGRVEGALFAAQVAGEEYEGYAEELENVRESTEGVGVAQQQMDQRTKGAAYAFSRFKTNLHDIGITLGSALLPELADLADYFSEELAKPSTVAAIKDLSKSLASGLKDAVKWAKSLPWDKIKGGLKAAAGFAKGLVDAFTSMPAEAQATILALVGLNKLSGGAVSGIVSELGKGLIKGVLGMTAGVVNLKALSLTGLGGLGKGGAAGAAPIAGGAAGGRLAAAGSAIMKVAVVGMAAAAAVVLAQELANQSKELDKQGTEVLGQGRQFKGKASNEELVAAIDNIESQFRDPLNALALAITNPLNGAGDKLVTLRDELKAELYANRQKLHEAIMGTTGSVDSMNTATGFNLSNVKTAVESGLSNSAEASRGTTQAVNSKDWSPTINTHVGVTMPISIRNVTGAQRVVASYNPPTMSGKKP